MAASSSTGTQRDTMFPDLDKAVSIYQECVAIPTPTKATLQQTKEGAFSVWTNWTQRDLERSEKVTFQSIHVVLPDGENQFGRIINAGCTTEIKAELLNSVSPSGTRTAVIREVKNKKEEEKQYLEVWDGTHKSYNVDLLVQEKHGKVYEDDLFGSLAWSSSETHLVYIAEKKKPKAVSYFDSKFQKKNEPKTDNSQGKDEPIKGDENVLREEWGETLVSKHHSVICVLDLANQTISVLDGIPDEVSAGHAIWSPNDKGIVFVGWFHEVYRLGIRHCNNRRSALYYVDCQGTTSEILSGTDRCVWCPRFSPDKTKLVYLRSEVGGPHRRCAEVVMQDWASKETKVIVSVVQKPSVETSFPGIYTIGDNPTGKCWLSDSKRLVLSSFWQSKKELLVVNTETSSVSRLTSDLSFGSWSVLDVTDDVIVAIRSAPNRPHQLVIGQVPFAGHETDIVWIPLDADLAQIEDIKWEILQLQGTESPEHGVVDYEAILLTPAAASQDTLPPLLVIPHGGPHSVIPAEFIVTAAAFCKLGFAVLMVNYRGSLGFGEASIQCLPGRIGRQDVDDVQDAVQAVLGTGRVDGERIVLSGGSHGGFLVTHLIGQFPDFYKACATRNPVINVASVLGCSDIPDWVYCEAGLGPFEFDKLPSPEMYEAMLNKSPIVHANKVKTPTLLMIGADDLRVPPKQSQEYYRALKAHGTKTKLLVYSDNHSLAKVDVDADCFMNMYKWFTSFA